MDGTGGNRGNRGKVVRASSVFSVSFVSSHCEEPTMHPLFAQASGLTHDVIGAAIEVHEADGNPVGPDHQLQ
jgi:hypothetical protein